jgi:hypothetical protein
MSFRPDPERAQLLEGAVEKSAFQPISPSRPNKSATTARAAILLAAALALSPIPSLAQGCTQCQDNTAATSPKTQRAYRRAIVLLTFTAGGLFVASLALFKRHR